jgi:hypothetical protein
VRGGLPLCCIRLAKLVPEPVYCVIRLVNLDSGSTCPALLSHLSRRYYSRADGVCTTHHQANHGQWLMGEMRQGSAVHYSAA